MLVSLIPLFDENLVVKAYSLFTEKSNLLTNPLLLGSGNNDGAPRNLGLEFLGQIDMNVLSEDALFFVPINNIAIFSNFYEEASFQKDRIVLLIDHTVPPVDIYVKRIEELKKLGIQFAIRKLAVSEFEDYGPILSMMDYVYLNDKKVVVEMAQIYFGKLYPKLKLCVGNIENMERFENAVEIGGFSFYEGDFYRIPVNKGSTELSPQKINYIQLLNLVNDKNLELVDVADVISKDSALTIQLLEVVNPMARNSKITSIRHAAAMLGQIELRKWINTVLVNALFEDKPGELSRLSLIRAKFAENLANVFRLEDSKEELYLMGLLSVLDVIMSRKMDQVMSMISVSDSIRDALCDRGGKLLPVMQFIKYYEAANWQEISRLMMVNDLDSDKLYESYVDALRWYGQIAKR